MIKISKYQGLGNDFIICDDEKLLEYDFSKLAQILCNNKKTGKTDGFIFVKKKPLTMFFYNQDGSIGTMCGNGLRCFVKYCYDNGIIKKLENDVITKAGTYKTQIINKEPFIVKVQMGKPNFSASFLKIKTDLNEYINQEYIYNEKSYKLTSLFMGTHHTVVFINSLEELTEELGHTLCHLSIFDDRTNVDFVVVKNEKELHVKTYERGVGYTQACGTGACASFVVASMFGLCSNDVEVHFELGSLKINESNGEIYMQGPAEKILSDVLYIEE